MQKEACITEQNRHSTTCYEQTDKNYLPPEQSGDLSEGSLVHFKAGLVAGC